MKIVLPHHKNSYMRRKPVIEVPVPEPQARILHIYMGRVHTSLTKDTRSPYLLVGDKGKPYNGDMLRYWFKGLQKKHSSQWQRDPTLSPGKLRSIFITSVRKLVDMELKPMQEGSVLVMGTSLKQVDTHYDVLRVENLISHTVQLMPIWKERVTNQQQ